MFKIFDLDTKSVTETKRDLSKIIAKVNNTGEPTFIMNHNKPEAVLLSNAAYENLVRKYEELEERVFEAEVARRIAIHDSQSSPKTFTSEDLGIDLTDVDWSEDDGWE